MIGLMREIPVSEHFERSIYGPHEISNPLINQYEARELRASTFCKVSNFLGRPRLRRLTTGLSPKEPFKMLAEMFGRKPHQTEEK